MCFDSRPRRTHPPTPSQGKGALAKRNFHTPLSPGEGQGERFFGAANEIRYSLAPLRLCALLISRKGAKTQRKTLRYYQTYCFLFNRSASPVMVSSFVAGL